MKLITINKELKIPLYKQIYKEIKENICNRIFQHNSLLPTEKQFEEIYGISSFAVRKAYRMLEDEDLIKRIKGLGTFVNFETTYIFEVLNKHEIIFPYREGFELNTILISKPIKIDLTNYLVDEFQIDTIVIYKYSIADRDHRLAYVEIYMADKCKISDKLIRDNKLEFNKLFLGMKQNDNYLVNDLHIGIADKTVSDIFGIDVDDPLFISECRFMTNDDELYAYIRTMYPAKNTIVEGVTK